jgi:hypothetical protein
MQSKQLCNRKMALRLRIFCFVYEMEANMQFEKCLTCPSIKGKQCAGPNFMTAPTKEVVEWVIAFQKLNGITNAQLAERSGIPKGTIDGLKTRSDVRHDTLYPLIKALIELAGGVWGGESCPAAVSGASEQQHENLRLTQELERAKEALEHSARSIKERTMVINGLFALCAGLIVVLLLLVL